MASVPKPASPSIDAADVGFCQPGDPVGPSRPVDRDARGSLRHPPECSGARPRGLVELSAADTVRSNLALTNVTPGPIVALREPGTRAALSIGVLSLLRAVPTDTSIVVCGRPADP